MAINIKRVVSNFKTTLSSSMTDTATSMTLAAVPAGTIQYPNWFVIEPKSANFEIVYCPTAPSGTTFSGVIRGVSASADTDTAGTGLAHPANVDVVLAPMHRMHNSMADVFNGVSAAPAVMLNPAARVISDPRHLVDMEYVTGLTGTAVPQFAVTQNGADPSLTINVGAGTLLNGTAVVNYAGAAAQAVAPSVTNYVQLTPAGVLVINAVSFTAGNLPLAEVVTSGTDITAITDRRPWIGMPFNPSTEAALVGSSGTPSGSNLFVTSNDPRFASVVPTGAVIPVMTRTAPANFLLLDGSTVSRTTYAALFAALFPSLGTFTITIASPGVVTQTAHGLVTGDSVYFTTTGALPTGLAVNTRYWIIYVDANTYRLATSLANALVGTAINTSDSQSGVHTSLLAPSGVGDGTTTFTLPDMRGAVVMGQKPSDADISGLGRIGGSKTATLTTNELPAHTHTMGSARSGGYGGTATDFPRSSDNGGSVTALGGATGSAGSGNPFNILPSFIALNFIIKT